jgi:CheY-like chemotaxis protein/DNA-directed RNA polymerase subunit RPC12/RpoP
MAVTILRGTNLEQGSVGMLLKCPNCGSRIRMTTPDFKEKMIRYLCLGCEQIVRLDLFSDEIQTSSSTSRPNLSHAIRVLVIDDAGAFLKQTEELLVKEGFEVITAQDGAEGLKKVSSEHPDVIVLDLMMPKMTGFEVLRTLKTNNYYKNHKHTPVLITSATYNPAESQILNEMGANGFISKDSVPEFLTYRIRKLLERTDKIPKPKIPLPGD